MGKHIGVGNINKNTIQTIKRAYVDEYSDVWVYVQTKAYDLAKHFRGNPDLKRRIGSL
jgi:nicotinate-nucleotide pyrophosphorylase